MRKVRTMTSAKTAIGIPTQGAWDMSRQSMAHAGGTNMKMMRAIRDFFERGMEQW